MVGKSALISSYIRIFPNDFLNCIRSLIQHFHAREQITVIKLLNSVKSPETTGVYLYGKKAAVPPRCPRKSKSGRPFSIC